MKSLLWIVAGLIATSTFSTMQADTPSHADSFTKEGLFKADVSQLKDTQLVAHPDAPLDPGQNVLWCGTLQLAWNKAIGLVGEKLHFKDQPPVVDLLNQEDFTDADLDPTSYVALADFERNHVEDEIRAALEKTFGGAASPELIPPVPLHPGPQDFLAYAYLFKNLEFAHPFAQVQQAPVIFNDKPTESFGFYENKDQISAEVFKQVSIYDYQSPTDFIVKLKTKSPTDELILAEIEPGVSLQATIDTTLKRMSSKQPEIAQRRDVLDIPKLNFDLRGDFPKLEKLVLDVGPNAHVHDLVTTQVKQLVRFQLNEKGAVLKSEATMGMMAAMAPVIPPKVHVMIFNKPFLILLKQTKSTKPYFALWVGNASLLVPAK